MHVVAEQRRKLATHPLTRDGIVVPGAAAMTPAACWNFALTGTVLGGLSPRVPEQIYSSILNINPFVVPNVVLGLQPTAIPANHPNCFPYLATLNTHIANAIGGNAAAQAACSEAMLKIVAVKNGLVPSANDTYRLHMVGETWFGWDHWALSFRSEIPGRPRVYIQTVTGRTLNHACTTIWDEGLQEVSFNIDQLHASQVALINNIDYGPACVTCGLAHGLLPSNPLNSWHRCTSCRAVYCPTHGAALPGKGWTLDPTRNCNRPHCNGRTSVTPLTGW